MNNWIESQTCPGYREKTIQRGDVTIIIRRPVLNETEQARREKHVQDTLGTVLNNYIRNNRSVKQ